jgi:glycosyltransferase involved in cell wall biosynthesis
LTKPSISLLIPLFNEQATLEATVDRCLRVAEKCTDDFELLILDDASRDRSAEIAEQLSRQHPAWIRCLRHEVNRGIAATFEDLYRAAAKEYVYLIPADNQFPPEALHDIIPLLGDSTSSSANESANPTRGGAD